MIFKLDTNATVRIYARCVRKDCLRWHNSADTAFYSRLCRKGLGMNSTVLWGRFSMGLIMIIYKFHELEPCCKNISGSLSPSLTTLIWSAFATFLISLRIPPPPQYFGALIGKSEQLHLKTNLTSFQLSKQPDLFFRSNFCNGNVPWMIEKMML